MSITLNVPQYSVTEDTVYWNDLFEEHKNLPMLCIGRDSYIEETQVEAGPDQDLLYSIQVGRYSSIARDTKMIIDLNQLQAGLPGADKWCGISASASHPPQRSDRYHE